MESPATKVTGFAATLTSHRKAAGLTQAALAEAAAIAPATLSRRMRRNDWTLNEMHAIADALATPLSELVTESEDAA